MEKRVLIVNFARLGDILQSQPLISLLREQKKEVRLCVLEAFARTCNLLQGIEKVYVFPGSKILATLDKKDWGLALDLFWSFVRNLQKDFYPDEVLNLTPTLPARLLTLFFPQAKVKGFGLDKLGFSTYSNDWAAFLDSSAIVRNSSALNLVDLNLGIEDEQKKYPQSLRLKQPDSRLIESWRDKLNSSQLIGFQLGASDLKRTWPVEYFVKLGKLCAQKGLVPVLLGSPGETSLAQDFAERADFPFHNLVGKTSLDDLSSILNLLKFLVTNDTGTMHIAAGQGCKIIALFLSTAQAWDTGPYLANCICLEPNISCHPCDFNTSCSKHKCRWQIRPEFVYAFVENYNLMQMTCSELRAYRVVFKDNLFSLKQLQATDRRFLVMSCLQKLYACFLARQPAPCIDLPEELIQEIALICQYFQVFHTQLKTLTFLPPKIRQPKAKSFYQMLDQRLQKCVWLRALYRLWLIHSQAALDLDGLLQESLRYFNFWSNCLNKSSLNQ